MHQEADKQVKDKISEIEDEINKISPEFPNEESNEDFLKCVFVIAGAYDSVVAATKLDVSDKNYIDPLLANKIIDGLKKYTTIIKDHDLASTYKVFKESLNENVQVLPGEGITQVLQKMTGIKLGASQSVDNLKAAVEKVGNGDYEKGLEVTKKLFTNNGAGSIDQQADKLNDVIQHGGKLGDAFTKAQGTFGNKGLFSVKLPPATTEKIVNTVAKIANKASQATSHLDTVKHAGNTIKHAAASIDFNYAPYIAAAGVIIGTGIVVGAAIKYAKSIKPTESRLKTLQGLEDRLQLVAEPEDISKPIELNPKVTNTKTKETEKSGVTVTPQNNEPKNVATPTEIEPTSADTKEKKPEVKTKEKVDNKKASKEDEDKTGNTTKKESELTKTVRKVSGEEEKKKPEIKTKKKESNKETTKEDEKAIAKEDELEYAIPHKYDVKYLKDKEGVATITLTDLKYTPESKKLKKKDIVVVVDPLLKKYYERQAKEKGGSLYSALNDLYNRQSSEKRKLIIDLSKEPTQEKLQKKALQISKASKLSDEQIKEAFKAKLLEDLYTPSLRLFIPDPKGRLVDKDDLERELRSNTPADNQNYDNGSNVYTNKIDSERLVKIDTLISQMGEPGVAMYNKYAKAYGAEPYDGRAKVFNPVQVPADDRTYIDGNGDVEPVKNKTKEVFESQKPNFVPEAQNFLQTLNDIYRRCIPKTGIKPFIEHLDNLDMKDQEPKLAMAYINHKLKDTKCEYKEELQKALDKIKAKYKS